MAIEKIQSDWFLYHVQLHTPSQTFYWHPLRESLSYPAEIGLLRVGTTTFTFVMPTEQHPDQRYALWFVYPAYESAEEDFSVIPHDNEHFAWAVRALRQIKGDVPMGIIAFGGELHPIIPAKLLAVGEPPFTEPPPIAPVWCPIANMVAERHAGPGGKEVWNGSKHFQPGAKLYFQSAFWGMGGESMTVVGRHRGSHRYVTMVVRSAWLVNWRADLVYSPHVIRQLWPYWNSTSQAKLEAETLAERMNRYHAEQREQPDTTPE